MLLAVRGHVARTVISTLLVLVAQGCSSPFSSSNSATSDVTSAYLATSPGGSNVVVGLAADMGPNAPIVLVIKWSGLYTIIVPRFPSPPGFCTNS